MPRRAAFSHSFPALASGILLVAATPGAGLANSAGFQVQAEGVSDLFQTSNGDTANAWGSLTGIHGGQGGALARLLAGQGVMAASGAVSTSGSGGNTLASGRPRVAYNETYHVVSASLPDGTPVTVTACARLDFVPAHSATGFMIFDRGTVTASVSACLQGATPGCLNGNYSWDKNGTQTPTESASGLFVSPAGTMTLNTIVGGYATLSGSITADVIGNVSSLNAAFDGSLQLSIGFGMEASDPSIHLVSTLNGNEAPATGACDSVQVLVHLPGVYLGATADAGPVGDPGTPRLRLDAVVPTPSRGRIATRLTLPSPARVEVALFDLQGRRVDRILDETLPAGTHAIQATLPDVADGVYLLVASAPGVRDARKVVLLR